MNKNMNTENYTRVGQNIYCYLRSNGRKTYRVRRTLGGRSISKTFHKLKDAKSWLTGPVLLMPKNVTPLKARVTLKKSAPRKTTRTRTTA